MKKLFCLGMLMFIAAIAGAQAPVQPAGQNSPDELVKNFLTPPSSAKPVTWWHWTAGNISKEGITKDLEWMKRVGIGGFQAIDVSFGSGQSVDKKIIFMTPEWLEMIRHAAAEADRLGLDMTMVTSAGWSETGGPWVKPEEAIKKVVWSEWQVSGGKKFSETLPAPPAVNGQIRNLPRVRGFGSISANPDATYYADQVVMAYRTPPDENKMAAFHPVVTTGTQPVADAAFLWDDDLTTKVVLPVPTPDKPTRLLFEFAQPFRAQAFSIALAVTGTFGSTSMRAGSVEASEDGKNFRTLVALPGPQHDIRALPVRTFSFPATTARFFRIEFVTGSGISTVGGPDDAGGFMGPAKPPATFDLTEAVFFSGARVNRWEDKANYAPMFEFESLATPGVAQTSVIQEKDIIDLSAKMNKAGQLDWDVPEGDWTILRMGYSLTGAKNSPAVAAGTGYEVDKLSARHLESYYHQYVDPIAKAMGPLFGKSMKYWLVDSYEADAQNWTDDMIPEFRKRRGYDPIPYLPVFAGRIVKSAAISDRFLWDVRKTIADLLAENHYGKLTAMAHQQGIRTYSEAAGISLPIIEDALQVKGKVDIPMGEFGMSQGLGSGAGQAWKSPADLELDHAYRGAGDRMNAHQSDVREAASAGHIYGKNIVAAESWTGGSYEAPAAMKVIGDYWNTQGINQFIFHTSAHQPLDTKPGNTMVGTHINRNITWAELAPPFMTYLARNQYLLQQGQFVADIAYYLGESIPAAVPYWEKIKPEPPAGYNYDFINTEILLDSMTVRDGLLVLSNGMTYQVLALPETDQMTPQVLKKIQTLVAQGATITGPKPLRSPSLAGYPGVDDEVINMANEIWGDADGRLVFQHAYGKGKVYSGIPLAGILAEKKVVKDFDYTRPHTNTSLPWIHRRTKTADIYFISNLRGQEEDVQVELRVQGKLPELWHSDAGTIEPVSYSFRENKTFVPLHLDPYGSVFLVLRKETGNPGLEIPKPVRREELVLTGAWDLAFPANLGAPAKIKLEKLISWSLHPDTGVKYFSGTAAYSKTFKTGANWFQTGKRFELDLGMVKDIAEVFVNGKPAGIRWKLPYKIDITEALKPGINQVEIRVTNQWTNRIMGDNSLPAGKQVLHIPPSPFGRLFSGQSAHIPESGLLGPVKIISVTPPSKNK